MDNNRKIGSTDSVPFRVRLELVQTRGQVSVFVLQHVALLS